MLKKNILAHALFGYESAQIVYTSQKWHNKYEIISN